MGKNYGRKRSGRNILELPEPLRPVCQSIAPYLVAVLFFFAICLSAASTAKVMALCCILLAVAAVIYRFSTVRDRFMLPLLVLSLMVLINGISMFYAVSGKFALYGFLKIITSFCLVLIPLALYRGENVTVGRKIASILERGVALASLVSIDMLSTRLISSAVISFLGLFTPDFSQLAGVEAGVRMTSIFENPNVFAGCAGLGVILALGLVLSSETERERMSHIVCLFINALAFVLAFSMGASGMIAAAFLAYLALEFKERRASLFLLMAETLILTLIGVVFVSMTSLEAWSGFQPVPLVCVIVGSALLCVLDKFAGRKLAEKLSKHGKVLLVVIVAALAALVGFALVAYHLTGGAALQTGEGLRRSAYPAPGEYVLTAQVDGAVSVTVTSQNRQETMMHTNTVLYAGDLAGAAFTVPEDSLVVYFDFAAGQDVYLESVRYEGANGSGAIPLDYKLLPGFIANRLQGLFANQNAIQRVVFFEDGLKLFRRSPLIGLGLGCFENGIMSVQSFYYETKYAHNHYIQALAETGVIGLIVFVALLAVSAAAVLLARRGKDPHPLTPALGAALVFMAGHAGVEVVFSNYSYIPVAFGVFSLINLCCGSALPAPWLDKKVKTGAVAGCSALMAVFLFLLCGNMMAADTVARQNSFDSLTQAVRIDKFEWADYMLAYVASVPNAEGDEAILAQADEYASRLAKINSNSVPIYLAEYYLQGGRVEQGMEMIEKYVNYVSSNEQAWRNAFDVLEAYAADSEIYRNGVAHIAQLLEDWNAENMGDITLSEKNEAFLAWMGVR